MLPSGVVGILENGRKTRDLSTKVAEEVREQPDLFPELMFGLWHVEGEIRCLAADAVEKATREKPELLTPFKKEILGLMPEARPALVRWHLAQMLPRLRLTKGERTRAIGILHDYLKDRSAIVQACAMDSLSQISKRDAELTEEAEAVIRAAMKTGSAAVKARGRNLLGIKKR